MIVLASSSRARQTLLTHAGIRFEALSPGVDERRIERLLAAGGASPGDLAIALADAKALAVLPLRPDDIVIGSDQVLDLAGERFSKPADRAAAADQLARLSGRTHRLSSAVSIARGDIVVWRHVATVSLTMRPLSERAISRYLDAAGEDVLHSVGAYLIEGIGIQLFSAIEGDYFAILGLPMLPLLEALRELGALES
jgi:septum formation protein